MAVETISAQRRLLCADRFICSIRPNKAVAPMPASRSKVYHRQVIKYLHDKVVVGQVVEFSAGSGSAAHSVPSVQFCDFRHSCRRAASVHGQVRRMARMCWEVQRGSGWS